MFILIEEHDVIHQNTPECSRKTSCASMKSEHNTEHHTIVSIL